MSNVIEAGVYPPSEADLVSADIIFKRPLEQSASLNFFQRAKRWMVPYLASVTTTLLAIACGAPVKAGEQNSPVNVPAVVKEAPGLVASTPESTQAQESPVEQAVKAGKIELKQPQEWEKYFTVVSAEEARRLLAEAKEKGEFKFFLPFDPRTTPNLEIEEIDVPLTPDSSRRFRGLGLKNAAGLISYTPLDGTVTITRGGADSDLTTSWTLRSGGDVYSFVFLRQNNPFIPYDQPTPVEIGQPLLLLEGNDTFQSYYIGYQVVGGVGRNSRVVREGSLSQLLEKDNKIAIVSPSGK